MPASTHGREPSPTVVANTCMADEEQCCRQRVQYSTVRSYHSLRLTPCPQKSRQRALRAPKNPEANHIDLLRWRICRATSRVRRQSPAGPSAACLSDALCTHCWPHAPLFPHTFSVSHLSALQCLGLACPADFSARPFASSVVPIAALMLTLRRLNIAKSSRLSAALSFSQHHRFFPSLPIIQCNCEPSPPPPFPRPLSPPSLRALPAG